MSIYTNRLKLSKPQIGQCNWDYDWYRNQDILDVCDTQVMGGNSVSSGGNLTGAAGLAIDIDATECTVGGGQFSITPQTISLTGATITTEQTNWIYVDSLGALTVSMNAPSGQFAMIGLVDTNVAAVVRQSDLRQSPITQPVVQMMHVSNQQASGVGGGALPGGVTPTLLDLNTIITNTIEGAGLDGQLIMAPIGLYTVTCSAVLGANLSGRITVRYGSGDFIVGTNAYAGANGTIATVSGTVEVTSLSVYIQLEVITDIGSATGQGEPLSNGQVETYSNLILTKIG